MKTPHMSLHDYIAREIRLTKEEKKPNAISLRFVQLHEQASRSVTEEEEYAVLLGLMHSRWRWRWLRSSQPAGASGEEDPKTGE